MHEAFISPGLTVNILMCLAISAADVYLITCTFGFGSSWHVKITIAK